jgi:hypothetical protein
LYLRAADPRRVVNVEILWTFGANPVENLTTQIFLCADRACYTGIADIERAFVRAFA